MGRRVEDKLFVAIDIVNTNQHCMITQFHVSAISKNDKIVSHHGAFILFHLHPYAHIYQLLEKCMNPHICALLVCWIWAKKVSFLI